ncbi:MAG: hypothetical protein IAG10_18385 [Planctomycetaceae bacterium]|nr:hypothetical protein [Planctomycetaceae bacterium]
MALSTDLEILNRVLRELSSCFLQYAGECWPWISAGAEGAKLRGAVMQCVERQQQSIRLLAEHLAAHQDRVEFGKFSAEFTDLHYVSLTFLLKRLVESQKKLVESIDRTATLLPAGDECREILEVVRGNEHANLAALQAP